MSDTLSDFLGRFVLPLLGGGPVIVGGPISLSNEARMRGELGELAGEHLRGLLAQRCREFLFSVDADPTGDDLSLWIALHDTVAVDHPERGRVWARDATWRRVEERTGRLLRALADGERDALVRRHVAVDAWLHLRRADPADGGHGARRLRALPPGDASAPDRRRGSRDERWITGEHTSEAERSILAVLTASPLTCLIDPLRAPSAWSVFDSADLLAEPPLARAVCHAWSRSPDWMAIGARVTASLRQGVLEARDAGDRPQQAARACRIVGALVHLHVLRMLAGEARLGPRGVPDEGGAGFLALAVASEGWAHVLGSPIGEDPGLQRASRRWAEYREHLAELVPRPARDEALAALHRWIVQTGER